MAFLKAAIVYYKSLGITVLRVMTDNGSCYRSRAFAKACRHFKLKAHPNKTLYPANQRQGRTLHPNRVTRMGLRPRLSELQTTCPGAALLHAPLQLASTSATDHQAWPDRGQPAETPHVVVEAKRRSLRQAKSGDWRHTSIPGMRAAPWRCKKKGSSRAHSSEFS